MIENGYKCHSLIIEVKQNSGGFKMQTSEAEKDWLRRICGGQPVTERKTAPAKEAEHKPVAEKKANGHGFGDIAGMNELKEFVTEGFINVLKNRKCAEVYGIKLTM